MIIRKSLFSALLLMSGIWCSNAAFAQNENYSPEGKIAKLDTIVVSGKQDDETQALVGEGAAVGKTNVAIKDQPRSIAVITQQRMEDIGVHKVQDALVYTSGVYAGAYGHDSRVDGSIIRGVSSEIYIDGLKSAFGDYNSARPNAYSVDSVEILKGPTSVEYGQGNTGGIVNLRSKLPQIEATNEVTMELWII